MTEAGTHAQEITVLATVASTSPLKVTLIGDTTVSVPALNTVGVTLTVGDDVSVLLRLDRGRLPIVQGKVN